MGSDLEGLKSNQNQICSTCEDLETKIKFPLLNVNAKRAGVAEKLVHTHGAKKF